MVHRGTTGRRLVLWLSVMLTVALLAASCGSSNDDTGDADQQDTLSVVVSFYPLAEAAERVGGDLVSVTNLTPPGVEPHDLELTPGQVEAITTADVVVYLGGGFQPAVEEAVAGAEGIAVDALDAVDTVPAPPEEAEEGLSVDPHVWLDPVRYAAIVDGVAAGLGEAAPDE
ncbi:MAG TPA: metal ABC transporter substrate-binding protein, partial [Actinomycetota bacterium]